MTEKIAKVNERIQKSSSNNQKSLNSKPEKATIVEVTDFFLLKQPMNRQKLQKLCYYAEAWSEALLGQPIAEISEFQAWVNGPENVVLHGLFHECGCDEIFVDGQVAEHIKKVFSEEQLEVLEDIWETYGDSTENALEILTQRERPWREARQGYAPDERCTVVISPITMASYYKSIYIGK